MNQLNQFLESFKCIGLLGYGVEGKSSFRYIRKYFQELKILVFEDNSETLPENDNSIKLPFMKWQNYINDVDLWIKSPGISWSESMENIREKITSQSELFLKYSLGKKIGVTGSLGKSTTCQYIYDALKYSNKQGFLGGNIGQPLFNFVDYVCEDDITVIELSSYQLKNISCSPDISLLLNLYPEHLDYHKTFEDYYQSKSNIGRFQTKECTLIYNNEIQSEYIKGDGKKIKISVIDKASNIYLEDLKVIVKNSFEIPIDKKQFWKKSDSLNICAVVSVLIEVGMNELEIKESLKCLSTLEFRLEYLGEFKEVEFYNDSISTIPEATINALQSISNVDCLVVGGFNRGIDQQKLIGELIKNKLKLIFCMGETGKIIFERLDEKIKSRAFLVNEFDEIFQLLDSNNNIGKCVFSPGAPSFGLYKNFRERGKAFNDALSKWKK